MGFVSAQSVRYIFGNSLGNKDAEKLLLAIQEAGHKGLSRKEISVDVFQRNKPAEAITGLLALLMEQSRVQEVKDSSTGGRRPLRYFAFGVPVRTN